MEHEIELLSRVAVNHLFLGQLEPFRAALLSLRRRDPRLAAEILRVVVLRGGRVDGSLCRSPSELAWFAVTELLGFDKVWADWGLNRRQVRLEVEFLLLAEMIWRKAAGSGDIDGSDRLRWMLDWGVSRLKGDGDGDGESAEVVVRGIGDIVLRESEVFDALCWNLHNQVVRPERAKSEVAAGEKRECIEKPEGLPETAAHIHKAVQLAHLGHLKECVDSGDSQGAVSHIRYLHLNAGLEEAEYRSALKDLIKMVYSIRTYTEESWNNTMKTMLMVYIEAISSGCIQLVGMIQVIQDELTLEEIEQHRVSDEFAIPLPLQKYLDALKSANAPNVDFYLLQHSMRDCCMVDMYHYARISGSHVLERVLESALSFVKRECLKEASDVLYLFPLLQPLVAVMGWDLLSGKTELRRNMMHILWTSKSKSLKLEEHPLYDKQSDEMSCVEYLCDLLCFHLDLASFVACVNSGQIWNSKYSTFSSRKEHLESANVSSSSDPFVENFVLERLSVQTPLRVLFDVVPGIKFQDAFELITMQPICSSSMAWKRMQDIELLHVRYALDSAVLSLGAMEMCSNDSNENLYKKAMWHLDELRDHVKAITSIPRKVFLLSILISLLHMDKLSVDYTHFMSSNGTNSSPAAWEQYDLIGSCEGPKVVVSFIKMLLDMLHSCSSFSSALLEDMLRTGAITSSGKQALEWRTSTISHFVEDWVWRLSILQQLLPVSGQYWGWKEALAILRAAPSSLLNLCLQKAKYDIGEEAVHRFSLPAEDKAALELSEWVAGAFRRASVEDTVSRAAEENDVAFQELDFSTLRSQLGSLVAVLLCVDAATTSAKSLQICMLLLTQARSMLSEVYPGGSSKAGMPYWDQIQEFTMISVIRRILHRMLDLLEQEKTLTLCQMFSGETFLPRPEDSSRQGQRERALSILQKMIDDAHQGKRQFLSGKLHNLASALAEEDSEANNVKGERPYSDKKLASGHEKGPVLGLAYRLAKPVHASLVTTETIPGITYDIKDMGKRLLGPLGSRSSTYLSAFILYIATIGDIVDGVDTTHDFNFFSLIYEWPKDLLIRLVFERGSSDAAENVADIMRADFVHEVISACVPPVFPPRSSHGWACIPTLPSFSRISRDSAFQSPRDVKPCSISASTLELPQYPLQLEIVKHLANSSPVRAILACVFGSGILSISSGSSVAGSFGAEFAQTPDTERLFYEFALDQSERFPALKRWIQMQSNLHKVSESAIAASRDSDICLARDETKASLKRSREPESDTESDIDEISGSAPISTIKKDPCTLDQSYSASWHESPTSARGEPDSVAFISLDWENEGPYEKAVGRLIDERKFVDALAISDRFLRNGASDQLLQLLIEHGEEETESTLGAYASCSSSWQYCLRLKDKHLAARIAIKYLHKWELDHAMDVLTMCSFHLQLNDPVRSEVLRRRQALQKYSHILSVDDGYNSWQEIEADCIRDSEGLALRLAGKGAVSAALEVAESAALSVDLRRELQGRQLVKLLTTDPLSGGGPAEASRFLSSLPDPDDALPVAMGAMQQLHDLRSKQLLVNFFLKRRAGTLSDHEVTRLNLWALGLRVLAILPAPWQQKCSALHEHPHLILEVLLMTKQLQYASLMLKEFPSLRDDNLILVYSAKAISISVTPPRESRMFVSNPRTRQKARASIPSKSSFASSLSNLQKEARRAFSWAPRDTGSKDVAKETHRKRKSSGLIPNQRGSLELMSGIQEEHSSVTISEGQDRPPSVSVSEEWLLTGDPDKDSKVRLSHRYESSPDISLLKGLLSLCSDDLVSAKGALNLCVDQMKSVLSAQKLPLCASMEAVSQAYRSTETFVQALNYAKTLLRKLGGSADLLSNSERSRDLDASSDATSSSASSQFPDELSDLQAQADNWLGSAELLQSLLGSGIIASLDDIADKKSSAYLRDRLIQDERYSMAVYTCKKCKIDAFPVWNSWGHALLRMEHYAQARIKFKQALQLYKADPSPIVSKIIDAMEGEPPVDVASVRSMYQHLAKSASTIMDDSLSADAYLNVLHMPSTFPRSERSRSSMGFAADLSSDSDIENVPHSNLDNARYVECIHYLQEYARPQMLGFMFKHGHYSDACLLFFPPCGLPSPSQLPAPATVTSSSSPQRPDPLATDYGTIEDLCGYCIGYGAVDVLGDLLSERISAQDSSVGQYITTALSRICNYCESHRHFNFLYKFQVMKKDHFAAGLTCIQLFTNSSFSDEATRHLENAKMHFDEALSTRKWGGEATRLVSKAVRGKSASEKLTEDALVKLSTRVALQVEVLKAFNNVDGPPWKHTLFGNPNDQETFRRRCKIAEVLAERNFDLAFRVICEFGLPAVDIYASVASSLAERKKSAQLMEHFKNIKAFMEVNEWDEVLGAAINTYAEKHKERHDRLIDMLNTNHRKVLACVVCGRLKSAFQIASRSGSVADVQYVAHQALQANALPVLEMCRQWLSQYM